MHGAILDRAIIIGNDKPTANPGNPLSGAHGSSNDQRDRKHDNPEPHEPSNS